MGVQTVICPHFAPHVGDLDLRLPEFGLPWP